MGDKEQRESDACDCYRQAANCFKAAGDKSNAVECYLLCAECEQQPHIKAQFLVDASKILKSYDTDGYYKLILQIVQLYSASGRTANAASISKDAAEKAEEDFDYERAATMFDQAAQMYEMDSNDIQVNQMRNKWADITILSKPADQLDFKKIIKCYEKIGYKYLT